MAPSPPLVVVAGPAEARALFAPLATLACEAAMIAYLGPERRLLGVRHVAGGIDSVDVSIRRIARDALGWEATGLLLAHNHPGGDARPSAADMAFTRRLVQAMEPIGVRVVDHLVLARGAVVSLREMGVV